MILSVVGSSQVAAGQEVFYNISFRNISNEVLEDVSLVLTLPSDFRLLGSDPSLPSDHVWVVGDIPPSFETSFKLTGTFQTAATFQRIIDVTATTPDESGGDRIINRASTVTDIVSSPIAISQTLVGDSDDVVLPGESLRYRIDIENRSSQSLTNLIVSTDLVGNGFKLGSLKAEGGILAGRTITWAPGGINALRTLPPGGTVAIEFKVDVLNPPTTIGEKAMVILSRPRVTSLELKEPILGPEIALKIKTQVDLTQSVDYLSGQWPMRPGLVTRFKITWRMTNTTNRVTGARVSADVPLGSSSFSNAQSSSGTTLSANSGADLVNWDLRELEPHTTHTAEFVITYTPSVSDVGQTPTLVNNISLEGTDSFVSQPIFDETPVGPAKPKGSVEP